MVVFYPTPNVHFQAIGWDISIEQAILLERRATRVSQDRARKWQARATPAGHLPSLSGAHSHVSSAEACLCPRGKKGGRQTMGRTFTTLLPFFFLFNYCYYYLNTKREPLRRRRSEGHQKEKREMTGVRSLRFSALCWLASLTARRE